MELIRVGEKTYYIKNATNIGVYKVDYDNVYIIDSGNDKEAGKKILKIISEQGWNIKGIINTHSNADHIGGLIHQIPRVHIRRIIAAFKQRKNFFPFLFPNARLPINHAGDCACRNACHLGNVINGHRDTSCNIFLIMHYKVNASFHSTLFSKM